ncbi:helix-turn-helix domain-containing protein [Weissella cibaria]|uniref:helix-turn-helix domain-containing protein n=1 Tax=Weissella cibaria TaxID=137591 RepID=UPI0016802BCE|nr:helix-turn-helix transcriptional regulator [Weissella cibaria]MBD1502867.1 XRE family transcriptional regulator [Weissella cibaria]MCG4286141.1 helix-turn-helix transcriptional regulator [Weissella cibaria]
MKVLSGALKRRREQLGISQAEAAEGICHQSLLSRIERLDEVSNITVLQKLCDRLQLTVSDVARMDNRMLTTLSVVRQLIERREIEQAAEALENPGLMSRIPVFAYPEYNVLSARVALAENRIADAMQLLQLALGDVEKHQYELTVEIFTEMGVTWLAQGEHINASECFERARGIIHRLPRDVQLSMARVIAHTNRHRAEMYLAVEDPQRAMERVTEAIGILPAPEVTDYHEMVELQMLRSRCADALSLEEESTNAKMLVYAAAEFSKDAKLQDDVKQYLAPVMPEEV